MTEELAGALRERVAIERRLGDRDIWAGARARWAYDGAAWVAVTPLAPAAQTAGEALAGLPRWRVTMRKREGIGAESRLVWRGRFLAVRGIESDPAEPARMRLTCEEMR